MEAVVERELGDRTDEIEEAILLAVGHRDRRIILKIVGSSTDGVSYTEILGETRIPTGSLNYHLKQLEGFMEKGKDRKYRLTPLGVKALSVLRSMVDEKGDLSQYIRIAALSHKESIYPTVKWIIYMGIVFDLLVMFIWGYIGYISITEGAPWIVYVVLAVLLALGSAGLVSLIGALRTAPSWVRRLERKLGAY